MPRIFVPTFEKKTRNIYAWGVFVFSLFSAIDRIVEKIIYFDRFLRSSDSLKFANMTMLWTILCAV